MKEAGAPNNTTLSLKRPSLNSQDGQTMPRSKKTCVRDEDSFLMQLDAVSVMSVCVNVRTRLDGGQGTNTNTRLCQFRLTAGQSQDANEPYRLPPVRQSSPSLASVTGSAPLFDPFAGRDLRELAYLDERPEADQSNGSEKGSVARFSREPASQVMTKPSGTDDMRHNQYRSGDRTYSRKKKPGPPPPLGINNARYRAHLGLYGIYLLPSGQSLPDHVQTLVQSVLCERDAAEYAPEPLMSEISKDHDNLFQGLPQTGVEDFFLRHILINTFSTKSLRGQPLDTLRCCTGQAILPRTLPCTGKNTRGADRYLAEELVSPVPGMLYGYDGDAAFLNENHHGYILSQMKFMQVPEQHNLVYYPFLAGEFQGYEGNVYETANKCLVIAATLVKFTEWINGRLLFHKRDDLLVDPTAFSLLMNGPEVRLYVAWKKNDGKLVDSGDFKTEYYMADIECYHLRRPADLVRLRRVVYNILLWGRSERLPKIVRAIETLATVPGEETS